MMKFKIKVILISSIIFSCVKDIPEDITVLSDPATLQYIRNTKIFDEEVNDIYSIKEIGIEKIISINKIICENIDKINKNNGYCQPSNNYRKQYVFIGSNETKYVAVNLFPKFDSTKYREDDHGEWKESIIHVYDGENYYCLVGFNLDENKIIKFICNGPG